ncbi:MAG: NTP transferase domain-containing protein [Promethearchaeota archaeon]
MDAIILAAGEGRRFQAVSPSLPKCLYPLNAQSDCLLSRILQQLIELKIRHIYIVGGYRIEQLSSWLENSRISPKIYTLVDARDNYKRGPLHSLMAFSQEIREHGDHSRQYLVCPADTWYSQSFIAEIEKFIIQQSTQEGNILFYGKAESSSPLGSMALEIDLNHSQKITKITRFQSIAKKDSLSNEMSKKMSFILPIMVLSTDFFHQAQKLDLSEFRKAIVFIQAHLGKKFEFFAREALITTPFYLDIDTPKDLKKIQKFINI